MGCRNKPSGVRSFDRSFLLGCSFELTPLCRIEDEMTILLVRLELGRYALPAAARIVARDVLSLVIRKLHRILEVATTIQTIVAVCVSRIQ